MFQETEQPRNTNGILIPQTTMSIAEPTDIQINALVNNTTTIYLFAGLIKDEKMLGSASILDYMNENLFNKSDTAINEYHYYTTNNSITKKHIIHNIDNTKTYNTKNNRYTDKHYYNKTKQD